MRCCLPHLLAILTACSTVLAGIPLFAAALAPERSMGECVSTAPFEADDGAESRGEGSSEARAEEEQSEEDGDGEVHMFSGHAAGAFGSADPRHAAPAVGSVFACSFFGLAFTIRGPPAP